MTYANGTYTRRGTNQNLEPVSANELLVALKGRYDSIRLEFCRIEGEVRIAPNFTREGNKYPIDKSLVCTDCIFVNYAGFYDVNFHKAVNFENSVFKESAVFDGANFQGNAVFRGVTFQRRARFGEVTFQRDAVFLGASFQGGTFLEGAFFYESSFQGEADFTGVVSTVPIMFRGIRYWPNTVGQTFRRLLLNKLLGRFLWRVKEKKEEAHLPWLTRKLLPEKKYPSGSPDKATKFILNTELIDGVTAGSFKRYVDDMYFIDDVQRDHPNLAWIWRVSSDYGRSLILWGFWSMFFALLFAVVYTYVPGLDFMPQLGFLSALYFSIVTFTTLGFGDIVAVNVVARVLVIGEVVLGYVMLGGLIAIFATKVARRS